MLISQVTLKAIGLTPEVWSSLLRSQQKDASGLHRPLSNPYVSSSNSAPKELGKKQNIGGLTRTDANQQHLCFSKGGCLPREKQRDEETGILL
jgi:hypothetical protein